MKSIGSDRRKFVLKYGLLKFGLPGGITMVILYTLFNVNFNFKLININSFFTIYSPLFIILFLIGGVIYGEIMWLLFNAKKNKEKNK